MDYQEVRKLVDDMWETKRGRSRLIVSATFAVIVALGVAHMLVGH